MGEGKAGSRIYHILRMVGDVSKLRADTVVQTAGVQSVAIQNDSFQIGRLLWIHCIRRRRGMQGFLGFYGILTGLSNEKPYNKRDTDTMMQ